MLANIYQHLPADKTHEVIDLLVKNSSLKIERIVSHGHSSPESGWYDQSNIEWVMLLQGEARLEVEHDKEYHLVCGSYLTIPAHVRHRVTWTLPEKPTIWLAIHY